MANALPPATGQRTVRSLDRGLDVLEALYLEGRELGITELGARLRLAKGSVARLVTTLARRNYISRNPKTAKYRLGLRSWEVGCRAVNHVDVRALARPVLEQLHAATQETVHLTALGEDGHLVFLDKLDSTRAIRPNIDIGDRVPPHCVADGKALLACRPAEEVKRMLPRRLVRFTPATVRRKRDLLDVLREVRAQGYAVDRGEWRADVSGVAAPVLDHSGQVVAALGISLPSIRMTEEVTRELLTLAVKGAREISLGLGRGDADGGVAGRGRDARARPVPGRARAGPRRRGGRRLAKGHGVRAVRLLT
jgi:IclR family transcriptional regulator, KDG regulon repressor